MAEALAITVSDMPSWDDIEAAWSANKVFSLEILGKGAVKRTVEVLPELIARAREHIDEQRADVVLRARRRNPAYRQPDALFLSHTTGAVVDPNHMSRRISHIMRSVGIENAAGHRFRAAGLQNLIEAYDGVDDSGRPLSPQQVLWKVAERAGHRHIESLRPYLNMVRSARHATSVDELIRMRSRVKMLERENAQLKSERPALRPARVRPAPSLLAAPASLRRSGLARSVHSSTRRIRG